MKPRPFTSATIIAAGLLCAITLFVFFVLQDYGPESALRRFHEAIVQRDAKTLSEVTIDPNSQIAQKGFAQIYDLLVRGGSHYRLMGTDRHGRSIGAEVMYVSPNGQVRTIYWIVRKQGVTWMVDPVETSKLMTSGRT